MSQANLAYNFFDSTFSLEEWDYLVNETANVFRLDKNEKAELYNNNTARLIAAIPFEAGCDFPEKTAIAHLCLYMTEKKGFSKYCSHSKSDDKNLFNRLDFISDFHGGDREIIDHGMNILALIMIEGYKKSMHKDMENNVYNPFVSGVWDYREIKNSLLTAINKTEVPGIDWIIKYLPLYMW